LLLPGFFVPDENGSLDEEELTNAGKSETLSKINSSIRAASG
jgi:hypothetical protein